MPILLNLLYLTAHFASNCSLLSSPYFAQNFASKFGQGLIGSLAATNELCSLTCFDNMVVDKPLPPSVSTACFGETLPLSWGNNGPLEVADGDGLWVAGVKLWPLPEPTLRPPPSLLGDPFGLSWERVTLLVGVGQWVGVVRGLSWGGVGESWGLSFLGEVACDVGVSLGVSWVPLGVPWVPPGVSWVPLGVSWVPLEVSRVESGE